MEKWEHRSNLGIQLSSLFAVSRVCNHKLLTPPVSRWEGGGREGSVDGRGGGSGRLMRKATRGSSRMRVIRTHAEVSGMLLDVVSCVMPLFFLFLLLLLLAEEEDPGSTEASRTAARHLPFLAFPVPFPASSEESLTSH